ncbi:hypothetical protein SAMN04487955_103144 [Halomonas korlensis]|uniref:Uncharacterized protein n=1 Tax=Halomonas korlensis TaxID=463301 RepID=A0A1I7GP27_9GAMM|nr:hypothetical protein SAMN04487955_103144 [Halomonas korlensis]
MLLLVIRLMLDDLDIGSATRKLRNRYGRRVRITELLNGGLPIYSMLSNSGFLAMASLGNPCLMATSILSDTCLKIPTLLKDVGFVLAATLRRHGQI